MGLRDGTESRGGTEPRGGAESRAGIAPVLDAELVDELARVPGRRGPTLLHDLVPDLVGSLGDEIRQIRAALERGLRTDAARRVHELSGSLGAVGARRAATALSSVESAIRLADDPPAALTRLRSIEPVLAQAGAALLALVGADGPTAAAARHDAPGAGPDQP